MPLEHWSSKCIELPAKASKKKLTATSYLERLILRRNTIHTNIPRNFPIAVRQRERGEGGREGGRERGR